MGKHRSNETSTSYKSADPTFKGRHDARNEETTERIRVDTDSSGRVTGWSVGREIGSDNYER